MKPSNIEGVVAILDTVPECKVVLDALEDRSIYETVCPPKFDDFMNSLGVRFRLQTQTEPKPPTADAYVEPVWKNNPEFQIETQDVDFIKLAAKRVLENRQITGRIVNSLTARTKAARTILANF